MNILLVDDESSILVPFAAALRAEGHSVATATDGVSAVAAVSEQVFDVVISDVRLPRMSGLELFERVRREAPKTRVILMTAYATVPDAVTALKAGADDYLTKPFDLDHLVERLERYGRERTLEQARSDAANSPVQADEPFVGRSPSVTRLFERVERFAQSDAPVLITGESGTGKELLAHALHEKSRRRAGPFVAVNCAAFPDTLLDAELFGHERGAFTGAVKKREGRFRAAEGGTLFLDEVAELSLSAQAKLLRVLQEGTFEPLGTNESQHADVRIISATHQSLTTALVERRFRTDLYYRLNALELIVPPLRERGGDLMLLVEYFLKTFALGPTTPRLSTRALMAVSEYPYPGNVRELRHAMQSAVVLAGDAEIDLVHLPAAIGGKDPETQPETVRPLPEAVRAFEREYVKRAVQQTGGRRTAAAALLGISRKNLWEKLRGFGFSELELSALEKDDPSHDKE